MVAASLVSKLCVLSGLIFLSWINSNFASVPPSTSALQTIDFGTNATKLGNDGDKTAMDAVQSKNKKSILKTFWLANEKTAKDMGRKSPKSLLNPEKTFNKILVFIQTGNNFLNGQTNFPRLDKMMRTFDRLYYSNGMGALNNFLNMFVSLWTVIDAVASIFRAYETRYLNVRDENAPQPPNPLEDLQTSLDAANNNIAVISNVFQSLGRMGEFDDMSAEMGERDIKENRENDEDRAISAHVIKRTSWQGASQNEESNNNETNNSHDDKGEADKNNGGILKDFVYSKVKKEDIQNNRRLHLPIETKRYSIISARIDSNYANNRQTLYSERQRNGHSNPVRNSKQMKRISGRDFDNRINKRNLEFHQNIADHTEHVIRNKRSNGQYTFGIEKFVYVLSKLNNVLNSNTNNRQINRFTLAFSDLFASDGFNAFNTFYTLLAAYWTVVDAVANIFRFNEARIRDQIIRNQDQNQPDPLGDLQAELDDTNTNLEEVAELITTLGEAGEIIENPTGNEFDRSSVKKKKKSESRRKKPSFPTTFLPTPHFYKPVTHARFDGRDHHIQPTASDTWQPIDRNRSPINSQSQVESNRHVYYPVSYGSNNINSQSDPVPFSTTQRNLFTVSRGLNNAVGGLQRQMNLKPLSIPADQYAINYYRPSNPVVSRLGMSNLFPRSVKSILPPPFNSQWPATWKK